MRHPAGPPSTAGLAGLRGGERPGSVQLAQSSVAVAGSPSAAAGPRRCARWRPGRRRPASSPRWRATATADGADGQSSPVARVPVAARSRPPAAAGGFAYAATRDGAERHGRVPAVVEVEGFAAGSTLVSLTTAGRRSPSRRPSRTPRVAAARPLASARRRPRADRARRSRRALRRARRRRPAPSRLTVTAGARTPPRRPRALYLARAAAPRPRALPLEKGHGDGRSVRRNGLGDRFSFGLWTVGHRGGDPFGLPTRPPIEPEEIVAPPGGGRAPGASASTTTTSCRSARSAAERDRIVASFARGGRATPACACRWRRSTSSPSRSSATAR